MKVKRSKLIKSHKTCRILILTVLRQNKLKQQENVFSKQVFLFCFLALSITLSFPTPPLLVQILELPCSVRVENKHLIYMKRFYSTCDHFAFTKSQKPGLDTFHSIILKQIKKSTATTSKTLYVIPLLPNKF